MTNLTASLCEAPWICVYLKLVLRARQIDKATRRIDGAGRKSLIYATRRLDARDIIPSVYSDTCVSS